MSMPLPRGGGPVAAGPAGASGRPLTVLLVEDDRADAMLVEELLADAAGEIGLRWVRSLAAADDALRSAAPDCVVLDLDLPDGVGLGVLARLTAAHPAQPIVVLTGRNDDHFGTAAVAAGAQDFLVKGRVEPETLRRVLVYAIERKRAEVTAVALEAGRLREEENARLERALLPSPLLAGDPGVEIVARSRPTRQQSLLGGDFYDIVQTDDGTVHVMIGDVAGHGADAAALGVALRIGWRALTFAGLRGARRMEELDRILTHEGAARGVFATVLSVAIAPGDGRFTAVRAGHPGMLVVGGGTVSWLEPPAGPALGIGARRWPEAELTLAAGHALLLLTDGLFEGRNGPSQRRLGEDGLLALARPLAALPGPQFVDALIAAAERRAADHGGLTDDVAVIAVRRTGG